MHTTSPVVWTKLPGFGCHTGRPPLGHFMPFGNGAGVNPPTVPVPDGGGSGLGVGVEVGAGATIRPVTESPTIPLTEAPLTLALLRA